jgi:CDP-4-dehydro-6-deoxyglucose reductase/3-phenylpropionate/trans-cinnamate dioxygenase ferredoxin reductase subunit/phenol hydroxylase P5 protein
MPKLTFRKQNHTIELKESTELVRLPYLTSAVSLPFGCCQGTCGTCAIKVLEGEDRLSPKTKQEEITLSNLGLDGYRLACQCALKGDVVINS